MDPRLPIRSLDYTVIFARQMPAMREFYGTVLGFPLQRLEANSLFELVTLLEQLDTSQSVNKKS